MRNMQISLLVSRKNCIEIKEGYLIKDLRIFADRDINNIIIVDDQIYSFAFQIENGIPVKSYEGSEEIKQISDNEEELKLLKEYLIKLYENAGENIALTNYMNIWISKSSNDEKLRTIKDANKELN